MFNIKTLLKHLIIPVITVLVFGTALFGDGGAQGSTVFVFVPDGTLHEWKTNRVILKSLQKIIDSAPRDVACCFHFRSMNRADWILGNKGRAARNGDLMASARWPARWH